jgi:hypothetical protein
MAVRGEVTADAVSPPFRTLKEGAMTLLLLSESCEEDLVLLWREPSISSTLRATQRRSPKRVLPVQQLVRVIPLERIGAAAYPSGVTNR